MSKKLIYNDQYLGSRHSKNSADSSRIEESVYLNEMYDFIKHNLKIKYQKATKLKKFKSETEFDPNQGKTEPKGKADQSRKQDVDTQHPTKVNPNPNQKITKGNEKHQTHESLINFIDDKKKQITSRTINSNDIESHKSYNDKKVTDSNKKNQNPKEKLNNQKAEDVQKKNMNVSSGTKSDDIKKRVDDVKQRYKNMISENSINGSNFSEKKASVVREKNTSDNNNLNNPDENDEEIYENGFEKEEPIRTETNNEGYINTENSGRQNNTENNEAGNPQENEEGEVEDPEGEEEEIEEEELLQYYNEAARFIQNFIKINYMRRHYNDYNEEQEHIDNEDIEVEDVEIDNMNARNNNLEENPYSITERNEDGNNENRAEMEGNVYEGNEVTEENPQEEFQNEEEQRRDFRIGGRDDNKATDEEVEEIIETEYIPTYNNLNTEEIREVNHQSPITPKNNNFKRITTEKKTYSITKSNQSDLQDSMTPIHPSAGFNLKSLKKDEESPLTGLNNSLLNSQEIKLRISNLSEKSIKDKKGLSNVISLNSNRSNKSSRCNNESAQQINSNRNSDKNNNKKEVNNINLPEKEKESHNKSLSLQKSNSSLRSVKSRVVYSVIRASSSRNSSVLISPNSFDSPRLHRIHELIKKY